jgi:trigger factor
MPLEGASKVGHLHRVGSNQPVLGVEIDDYLVGKKEGEIFELAQPYPETHPDRRLAGKAVIFRLKIAAVKHKKLPPVDDEFAKDCGPYSSLAELKETLRERMDRALKKDIEEAYKEQIIKRLVDTHHFDLPDSLVERELETLIRQHLDARHRSRPKEAKRPEETSALREQYLPDAKRRVKAGLILEAVAEREGIQVEEQDLAAELERLATRLKLSPEEMHRMVQAAGPDMVDDLKGRILADKALDFVYRNAVVQG